METQETGRPTGRAQFMRYLLKLGIPNDLELGPDLRNLFEAPDEEFSKKRLLLLGALRRALRGSETTIDPTRCPSCEASKVPSLEVQIANFERWQRSQPEYFHWSGEEMSALQETLQAGDLLQPAFAMSVYIRRTNGSLELYERRK